MLVYSPSGFKGWPGLVGGQEHMLDLLRGAEIQMFVSSVCCCPRLLGGSWIRSGVTNMICPRLGWQFYPQSPMLPLFFGGFSIVLRAPSIFAYFILNIYMKYSIDNYVLWVKLIDSKEEFCYGSTDYTTKTLK